MCYKGSFPVEWNMQLWLLYVEIVVPYPTLSNRAITSHFGAQSKQHKMSPVISSYHFPPSSPTFFEPCKSQCPSVKPWSPYPSYGFSAIKGCSLFPLHNSKCLALTIMLRQAQIKKAKSIGQSSLLISQIHSETSRPAFYMYKT